MTRGHDVLVATKRCEPVLAQLASRGIPHQVACIAKKHNAAAPFVIAGLAKRFGADVVHTHHSTASLWGSYGAYLRGVPSVAHVHASNTAIWLLSSTHIIACADAVKAHLISQGRPADRISVAHNAVDVHNLPPVDAAEARTRVGVAPDAPLVTMAAHLSKKKGHPVLLRAVKRLRDQFPDLRCLAMGEEAERDALVAQAEQLGVSDIVEFTGYRSDAREVMAASDVVVLPSLVGEGLPLSLLEAAARERPIVATGLAGVPELIVDGDTGLLVEPGDSDDLAEKLAMLLADPALRSRMGNAAREVTVRRFSREKRGEAIERIYEVALAAKAGKPRPED